MPRTKAGGARETILAVIDMAPDLDENGRMRRAVTGVEAFQSGRTMANSSAEELNRSLPRLA
jgi:hypothetical protein